MNRFWSLLFFAVPLGGLAVFWMAANDIGPLAGAWLPENYSESGIAIDRLWSVVHWICAFFFALTGLLIGLVVWLFAGSQPKSANYVEGSVGLELTWSIIPGAILLGLAIYQLNVWTEQRVNRPLVEVDGETLAKPASIRVVAKQFGWEFHYPGKDNKFDTLDDFWIENLMVVPDDETTVLRLQSRDVIHSFFVPKMRLKHDVVPGMTQTAWFKPLSTGQMNIVCAELCGWGHYKMIAKLKIVSRQEYRQWLEEQYLRNAAPQFEPYTETQP